jgi:resolvase-like protein
MKRLSPERQRTKIDTYARLHDHEGVGLAEDLDVSGATSPFERPQLGPWLKRPDEWDGLIVAKYDRLTRSLLDFLVLYKWLQERGKTLIWIDPPLDFSTPFGKAMANVLITFAELELAVISERIREAWHGLREAESGRAAPCRLAGFRFTLSRTVGDWHLIRSMRPWLSRWYGAIWRATRSICWPAGSTSRAYRQGVGKARADCDLVPFQAHLPGR